MKQLKKLTVRELAQYLDVPTGIIYKCVKRGQLPHFKVGNRIYFDFETIKEYTKGNLNDVEN